MKKNVKLLIGVVLCLLPMLLVAVEFDRLPEQVAIHFNTAGEPDNYAPKALLFFLPVLMNSEAVSQALNAAAQMMQGGISGTSAEMVEASSGGAAVNMSYFIGLFSELALPTSVLDYVVGAVSRISEIIQASGVQIVLFIAALQSIQPSMYEVAKIEGATGYETFWKVTFPMVMPHIITNTIYTIVDAFSQSEVVKLAYTEAMTNGEYGLSSAFSVTSTLITCALLAAVVYFISKRTFYYN